MNFNIFDFFVCFCAPLRLFYLHKEPFFNNEPFSSFPGLFGAVCYILLPVVFDGLSDRSARNYVDSGTSLYNPSPDPF